MPHKIVDMNTTRSLPAQTSTSSRGTGYRLTETGARLIRALVLIVVGLTVTIGSAASDAYLHRGTTEETGVIYRQPTARGLATNVDLRGMSDNELASAVNFLRNGGYMYARQEFVWSEIQPTATEFVWTDYQRIVAALDNAGIRVVAVLVGTPNWARAPEQVGFADAPPLLPAFMESYGAAFRRQFPSIRIFQIGKNLDDPDYWGGSSLQNVTYRNLVRAAASGLDVGSTDSMLVAGEVGFNRDLRETGADVAKLRQLVTDPTLRGLVSVFAVAVDGGNQSPYDRRASTATSSLSRVVLIREALDDAGAVDVPVWFTHFGWTGDGGRPISLEDQANFVESGIRRTRTEWPWVGLIFNWTYAADPNDPTTATLPLISNGNPTALMTAMGEFSRSATGSSMTSGFAPADAAPCQYDGNWQDQHLANGLYRTVRDTDATVTCRFWGTGISVFLRYSPDAGTARFVVDAESFEEAGPDDPSGTVLLTYRVSDAFEFPVVLAEGLDEGLHTVTIGLADEGDLVIGGFLVERERPMIWPIAVLVAAGLVALFLGLRGVAYIAAEQVGMIARRTDSPPPTPLPVIPDWKPAPRFSRNR